MSKKDTIFDGIAEKFRRNIYESNKGRIRLQVLWDDMVQSIPHLSTSACTILDAGGGLGQIAQKCAELGHPIHFAEPSEDMIKIAEQSFAQSPAQDAITIWHTTVQNLSQFTTQKYELILFHAVLEWLAEPKETLQQLFTHLKPGGTLSLMFYNRNSAIMRTVLKGNYFRNTTPFQFGRSKSLTPGNPLDPNDVLEWLREWNISVTSKCGVRIFNDYLHAPVPDDKLDELIAVEKDHCRIEPFASLGRYIHLVCEKPL